MGRASKAGRTRIGMTLAVGMLAVLVAGCSGDAEEGAAGPHTVSTPAGDGGGMTENSASGEAMDRASVSGEAQGDAGARNGDSSARDLSAAQLEDRKLARSARMSLRTDDVDAAAVEARRIVSDAGGYVASERSRRDRATLTLTVPSEEMDAVLGKLAELGERKERQVTVEDLTDQIIDVDSRVASQRESVRRVRELLDQAESISDLVAIERELAQRESELESLLARQDALRGKVAMAPITLTLRETSADDDEDDGGFLGGLASGWGAFTALLGGTAVALGAALPFVVLAGVLAAVALAVRRWHKHARGTAPAPAGAAVPDSEA
ncbi:DUF4349 domain-containing protein [Haloechinothrix salitolerans]|uniref:DUF4349 domain-containing protein n=1 Tax=Haloechinothrix salitolerans TaxID=926830 RepID=A0ABW2CB88_9PSEU